MDFSAEFPVLAERVYLNHAAVAPLPRRAADLVRAYLNEATLRGSGAYGIWAGRMKEAREQAARLMEVSARDIGIVHNTNHGIMCIANSLPWRAGDNVVGAQGEYPANVQPWRQLAERGVAQRLVPESADKTFSIDDFAAAIDGRTRLVAVSLVQYSTGCRMPVEKIAELCRARGALLCVDAIQALGALPVKPMELGCDFLVAGSQKWMMAIEGAGLLWMRDGRADGMSAAMTGWNGRPRPTEYGHYDQAPQSTARRFEDGSYNMAAMAALSGSLALINAAGIQTVWNNIETLTAKVRERAAQSGLQVVSPGGEGERSGIVALDLGGDDPQGLVDRLDAAGIHVAARRGWLRIAPHFYNSAGQIDALFDAIGTRRAR